jgi:hypothetical protein
MSTSISLPCSFVFRIASQSLTQAFKILASEIEKTERNIQTAEDGLSELSLQVTILELNRKSKSPNDL